MTEQRQDAPTNRLAQEASPYLLQHARNPIDWWPWGDEAIEHARQTERPIFLSIGYSACHWCHVMEAESFEDAEIAAFLNEHFVAIKVDREERPDVDAIYMMAVQATTGQGGWPMSVWLDLELRPFYAGTYFPPRARYNRPGFLQVLGELAAVWQNDRDRIGQIAAEIDERVGRMLAAPPASPALRDARRAFVSGLTRRFDERDGGWSGAPKFPAASTIEALTALSYEPDFDGAALRMAERTAQRMAQGGLWDQLAGGFHRYSVDERWLIPHFEKMLYDNAQLIAAYAALSRRTDDERYAAIAREIAAWLDGEMTDEGGAFWSTQDADTEEGEGAFFVWTEAELAAALGHEEGARAAAYWGFRPGGNFEGANLPNRLHASWEEPKPAEIDDWRRALLSVRAERLRPATDTKIIASWNGLAIRGLAEAGAALGDASMIESAARAADFVCSTMYDEASARLDRIWKEGRRPIPGYLEDYAAMADGLGALFVATAEPRWLALTDALLDAIERDFAGERGLLTTTAAYHTHLRHRAYDVYDNATPSPQAVALRALWRFARLTDDEAAGERVARSLEALAGELSQRPEAMATTLQVAAEFESLERREIAVVLPDDAAPLGDPLARAARRARRPHDLVLAVTESRARSLSGRVPWLAHRGTTRGRATAYVCRQGACEAPIGDPDELARLLADA